MWKWIAALFGCCFLWTVPSEAQAVYLGQSAAGAADGSSCANARAASYFNSSSNWGTGVGQITGGVTIHLCGSISTVLTVPVSSGSGTIAVFFESGATLSQAAANNFIVLNNSSNSWVIDGGTACGPSPAGKSACNGIIQNTANGTNLANHVFPVKGIDFTGVTGSVEIRNLGIFNLYQHTGPVNILSISSNGTSTLTVTCATTCGFSPGEGSLTVAGNTNSLYNIGSLTVASTSGTSMTLTAASAIATGSGTGGQVSEDNVVNTSINSVNDSSVKGNISIHDCEFHDASWSINFTATNSTPLGTVEDVYNMDLHNNDHDITMGSANTNAAYIFKFHDNHSHDHTNWNTVNDSYHHDGIHTFNSQTQDSAAYIYNNLFDGPWAGNGTAVIFNQVAVQNLNLFNNVVICDVTCTSDPPLWEYAGGPNQRTLDNTIIQSGLPPGPGPNFANNAAFYFALPTGVTTSNNSFMNNISTSATTLFNTTGPVYAANTATTGLDFNLYANYITNGNTAWVWNGTSTNSFATWQSLSGGDSHSQFVANAGLSATGVPQTGSAAIAKGTNLSSLCTGLMVPLCSTTSAGNSVIPGPRPASGAWDVGAFQFYTPITACQNITAAGNYQLANNISGGASCIGVQASNVVLDLNGFTITFFTTKNTEYAAGIAIGENCNQPSGDADPTVCGGPSSISNVTVFSSKAGGTITESTNGDNFGGARGIQIGQQFTCSAMTVHDLTININQAGLPNNTSPLDSNAIKSYYCSFGTKIYNITYNIGYGRVSNRFADLGPGLFTAPDSGGGNGNVPYTSTICPGLPRSSTSYTPSIEICNNTLNGGTQGGNFGLTDYRHIYNNFFATNASSVDDFAIFVKGAFGEVDHNTINNPSGRGIQMIGNSLPPATATSCLTSYASGCGWNIHDNNVTVRSLPQWCADNGAAPCNSCPGIGGVFALEYKANIAFDTVQNNTFTAYANLCSSAAFRVTDSQQGMLSQNNTYSALLEGNKCGTGAQQSPCIAAAISFNAGGNSADVPFTNVNDTFTGDSMQVDIAYGAVGALFKNCTFIKPASAPASHVFIAWESFTHTTTLGIHFQDSIFQGGEDPSTNVMFPATPVGGGHPTEEYFVDWTYTVTVKDATTGNPISGAAVSITGNQDGSSPVGECSLTTNTSGVAACVLTQLHPHSTSAGVFQTSWNPHSVTISAGGYSPITYAISPTATLSETRALTSSGGTNPVVALSPASIAFPNQTLTTTSSGVTVQLSNTGTATLTITSIATSGTNAADFLILGPGTTCPLSSGTVAVGTSCNVVVAFAPTLTVPESASLTFTTNAATSPDKVTLLGTGAISNIVGGAGTISGSGTIKP